MNQEKQNLDVKIDLKKHTTPFYSEDGNLIFQEAVIFRRVNKFLVGQNEDTLVPITVFVDVKTGKICKDLLPRQLWEDFGFKEEEKPIEGNIIV